MFKLTLRRSIVHLTHNLYLYSLSMLITRESNVMQMRMERKKFCFGLFHVLKCMLSFFCVLHVLKI